MIFSSSLALTKGLTENVGNLSSYMRRLFWDLITGGAMIYWFTALPRSVTTGAYRRQSSSLK